MRAAKKTTAIAVLIALTIGLSYSQVCDFSCAAGACPASSATAASPGSREPVQAGHCHEPEPSPESEPESGPSSRDASSSPHHKGSPACPGHIDASTLPPGGAVNASPSHDRQVVQALTPRGFQALSGSQADSGISNREPPLRSPPTRAVLRI
ncbi:MAG TPA: hypothetical protein VNH22_19125 [Blastocatellia bacterium]|nr:hypothetical protein [Blastocatellia bacterium]